MTIKQLIAELSKIDNQDAEIILEDSILGLAVKLTHVNLDSFWQDGAVDLCGSALPNAPWKNEK
jgi:hypothetical protein